MKRKQCGTGRDLVFVRTRYERDSERGGKMTMEEWKDSPTRLNASRNGAVVSAEGRVEKHKELRRRQQKAWKNVYADNGLRLERSSTSRNGDASGAMMDDEMKWGWEGQSELLHDDDAIDDTYSP